MLCLWLNPKGIVHYELLKPGETVDAHHYRQQLININQVLFEKHPEWDTKHKRVILQYDKASCFRSTIVQVTILTMK